MMIMFNNRELIRVPREAVKYVIFQRTQYLFFRRSNFIQKIIKYIPRRLAYAVESLFSNFNMMVSAEAFFTHKTVEKLLTSEIRSEYESMKKFLPSNAKSILDIGCGVAGIDVFLYRHYQNQSPKIYLLDKTEMPAKVYYSFRPKGCYYNSLPLSRKLLELNNVPKGNIFTEEARDNVIDFNVKFDLVISLISWGFHYPVSTYLDRVFEILNRGGALILDIRKVEGSNGLSEVKQKFGNCQIIYESSKNTRIVAIKNT